MRQFILPRGWNGSGELDLDSREARYLRRVLRLPTGAAFPARDERGKRYECRLMESGEGPARLRVEALPGGPPAGPRIPPLVLAQGLPKGSRMDLIVRQATEAGISDIYPFISRHCVAKATGSAGNEPRSGRWSRIVREALQQSGSCVPTTVHGIVDLGELDALVRRDHPDARNRSLLLLHEDPCGTGSLHKHLGADPDLVVLCIGPEGGFAQDETTMLLGAGFMPVHFEDSILRTETAALYAIASVRTILMERSSWIPSQPGG